MHDMRKINRMVESVQSNLTDDLRKPQYRGNQNCLAGHCYVASEALYHMLGGQRSGWVPQTIQHEGGPHWYLKHKHSGAILDPTAKQFNTPVPYEKGRGCGFLTKQPSKRTQVVLDRISGLNKAEENFNGPMNTPSQPRLNNIPKHIADKIKTAKTPQEMADAIIHHEPELAAKWGGREFLDCDEVGTLLSDGLTHHNIPHHNMIGFTNTGENHAWVRLADGTDLDPTGQGTVNGKIINSFHGRVKKSEQPQRRVACSIAVFNSDGHLLMGQRNDSKRWTLPGGKADPGEAPEKCARRELKEEAGIDAERLKFLGHGVGGKNGDWDIFAYETHSDEKPTAENDPDRECDVWEWIDISNGLPKEIADALHNHDRDVTLQLLGLQKGTASSELSKGWKHAVVGAIAAAGLATTPQALAGEPDKKWSPVGLHEELHPIAHLESSGGRNVNHKPHPQGSFHTAVGAVGLKPITAHDEYKKSSWLQKVFPNLHDPVKFTHELHNNDALYNHVATAHWMRLKKMFGGDIQRAAYAWRWGQGAAATTPPELQAQDPYVIAYNKLRVQAQVNQLNRYLINPLSKEEVEKWVDMAKKPQKKAVRSFDHYSQVKGLKELDPKFQGTGSPGPEANRSKRIPRVYMYAADTAPETHIAASAKAKYRIELPHDAKFYDMGADEHGLMQPRWRNTKYGQFYEPADLDHVERRIKQLGYAGYYNYMSTAPNAYAVFSKVKARELPTLG